MGTTNKPPESVGKKTTKVRVRDQNKEKILAAAVGLFVAKGFDGTHIKEIAERCGLPKTNVYYYFSSKEEIYTALVDQIIERWDKAFQHIVPTREPADAIESYIRTKLEYSHQYGVESRFFASELLRGGKFISRRHRQHMRQVTDERAKVIEGWIREKKMAPVNVSHLFFLLWSSTQFYADSTFVASYMLRKRELTKKDYEEATKAIYQIVSNGCKLPGAS